MPLYNTILHLLKKNGGKWKVPQKMNIIVLACLLGLFLSKLGQHMLSSLFVLRTSC